MPVLLRRLLAPLVALLLAVGLSACSKTVSPSGYTGEAKEVVKTISNLQTDVTAGDEKKICSNDLASTLVKSLNAAKGGCQQAIKNQLVEIDNFELNAGAVAVNAAQHTATAHVLSVKSGKKLAATLTLVKEGSTWKISGLG